MWADAEVASELAASCDTCRKLGKKKWGGDVCLKTGGECARKDQWPAPPDLSGLSLRATDALLLFNLASTQWNVGMSGLVGLNYSSCELLARINGIDFEWVFPHLQALEAARLDHMRKRAEEELRKAKQRT